MNSAQYGTFENRILSFDVRVLTGLSPGVWRWVAAGQVCLKDISGCQPQSEHDTGHNPSFILRPSHYFVLLRKTWNFHKVLISFCFKTSQTANPILDKTRTKQTFLLSFYFFFFFFKDFFGSGVVEKFLRASLTYDQWRICIILECFLVG